MIHSWKLFTARQINAHLARSGSLWQRDYFDRLVRNEEHLRNCIRYIRRNPAKVHLRAGDYLLYENEFAKQVE